MKKLLIGILVTVGFLSSSLLFAQDTEELEVKGKVLQSDQVTAFKTPVPVLNVPQSVSIITDDEIRKKGYRELGDIVRYTPGVNTTQGEGHRDAMVFRGVRSTANFYLDGARDDVQYYRSLYNIEQVEVIKGANALLFGRDARGGLINRVTKKPEIGESFRSVDAGIDSFGAFDVAIDTNMDTSDSTAIRLMLHSDTLENHRDFFDGDRLGFNIVSRTELDADSTLDLSYEYVDHERFIDRGIPTSLTSYLPVEELKDYVFGTPEINTQTTEADIIRAKLTRELSDTSRVIVSLTMNDFDKMYQNLYVSKYAPAAANTPTVGTIDADGYRDVTTRESTIFNVDWVNELEIGTATHTILAGLEVLETENKNQRYYKCFSSHDGNSALNNTADCTASSGQKSNKETFTLARPMDFSKNSGGVANTTHFDQAGAFYARTETDVEITSISLQDQISINENVLVTIGGRFDQMELTVNDTRTASGATTVNDRDIFSPRAGLTLKPQENVSFFVAYSESFYPKAGEQYKKQSAGAAITDPDTFENTEIGFKMDINPDLMFTANYFDSDNVVGRADGEGTAETTNLSVDGFELELKGQITDQLYAAFGYANFDGETSPGTQAKEIPESTLSGWINYQVNDTFGWGIGFTSQGESQAKDGARSGGILPSYTRWDAAGYWTLSDDLSVQLNIENLTDTVYFPHAHSTHQISVGEEMNARVSLNYSF